MFCRVGFPSISFLALLDANAARPSAAILDHTGVEHGSGLRPCLRHPRGQWPVVASRPQRGG